MLLNNHPKAVKALLALCVLLFYDTLWDLFLSLLHHLYGMLHLMFEFCEHTLERLIEHMFHVDPRTAEVMVFYIMLSIGAYAAFKLIQRLPGWYNILAHWLAGYWQQTKADKLQYWQAQPLTGKIQWGAFYMAAVLVLIFWLSS